MISPTGDAPHLRILILAVTGGRKPRLNKNFVRSPTHAQDGRSLERKNINSLAKSVQILTTNGKNNRVGGRSFRRGVNGPGGTRTSDLTLIRGAL